MGEMDGLEVTDCTRCPELVDSRSQIVNGTGPADADLLFVGEGPGAQEDEQGEPFVGRSGTVLDDKLRERGLARQDVRITNCVRCRPPENRDPTAEELENCWPYLESEIEQVDPEVIITLGKVPSEHLLDRDVAVTKEAANVEQVDLGGAVRDVLVCVHPAATFYDRSQEESLDAAFDKAAAMADGDSNGQSQLGDF
ncbi:uracil-DNA glycosylase [Halorussus aquaticus]|uniref:Type-4 uracil-DNA glycosylase n=1 Tax=Halorussus aquaticus TaxID=2953748 RepID=A0ABD5Q6R6_9EURY|nr:uracil-DNA glycosylase [Halorussus aquaticus]